MTNDQTPATLSLATGPVTCYFMGSLEPIRTAATALREPWHE